MLAHRLLLTPRCRAVSRLLCVGASHCSPVLSPTRRRVLFPSHVGAPASCKQGTLTTGRNS